MDAALPTGAPERDAMRHAMTERAHLALLDVDPGRLAIIPIERLTELRRLCSVPRRSSLPR